jgi:hypothetical protein
MCSDQEIKMYFDQEIKMYSDQDVLRDQEIKVYSGIKMHLEQELRCTCINMYSDRYVLGSICARIKGSRCTRVTTYSDQDMLGIKMYSDQEINMYSNQLC